MASDDELGGLAPFQVQLLELSYGAVSKMPLEPHVKNRSRAQEAVVLGCLELGQFERALGYVEGIENWRRGAGFADLALFLAEHGGEADAIEGYLARAQEIADWPEEDLKQSWRRDRILAKIAQVRVILGDEEAARAIEGDIESDESARIRLAEAKAVEGLDHFDAVIDSVEPVMERAVFDEIRATLDGLVVLTGRHYGDEERRTRALEAIRSTFEVMPPGIVIDVLLGLAEVAGENDDQESGAALATEALQALEEGNWRDRDEIPTRARIARVLHGLGQAEAARAAADDALKVYVRRRTKITDIWRAGAVRPVAEAYQVLGETSLARAVYRRALEDGATNPNSRPRADDLSATCTSMAVHGVEPDESLWNLIRSIEASLSDPW